MEIFEYFGLSKDSQSIYKYAPVYLGVIDNKKVVIKKTKEQLDRLEPLRAWQESLENNGIETLLPMAFKAKLYHLIANENWVIYPFIEGTKYQATAEQIYGAGELLGKVHTTSDSIFEHGFSWEHYDDEFYDDVENDIQMIAKHYPQEFNSQYGQRLFTEIKHLASSRFSCLAVQELPTSDCTWDFKASNLIYQADKAVLIDTDNAGKVPRIFDLALALLLFHTTESSAPDRVFTVDEWQLFLSGYAKHVQITETEKLAWQNMLLFVYTDEVLWAINDVEEDESDRQKAFITSLITFNYRQYIV